MTPTPLGATGETNHKGGRMAGYHTWCAALSSVALCCAALSTLWCIAVKAAAAAFAAGAAAASDAFRLHSLRCNRCCSARLSAAHRCLPLQTSGSCPPDGSLQAARRLSTSQLFCRPPWQVCLPLHLLHRQPGHGGASCVSQSWGCCVSQAAGGRPPSAATCDAMAALGGWLRRAGGGRLPSATTCKAMAALGAAPVCLRASAVCQVNQSA